jgi:hypothetical protein
MSRPPAAFFTEKVYEIATRPEFENVRHRLSKFGGVGKVTLITSIHNPEFISKDIYITVPIILPMNKIMVYYIIPLKFSRKKRNMLFFHNLMKTSRHYQHTIDHPENEPDELILTKEDMEWFIEHNMVVYSYSHSNAEYSLKQYSTRSNIKHSLQPSQNTRKNSNNKPINKPKNAPNLKETRSQGNYFGYPHES